MMTRALAGLGFLATTSFGGCNALAKTDLSPLKGNKVLIWPDYDGPGLKYAENLRTALAKIAVNSVISLEITGAKLATICENQSEFALMRGWDAADAADRQREQQTTGRTADDGAWGLCAAAF